MSQLFAGAHYYVELRDFPQEFSLPKLGSLVAYRLGPAFTTHCFDIVGGPFLGGPPHAKTARSRNPFSVGVAGVGERGDPSVQRHQVR